MIKTDSTMIGVVRAMIVIAFLVPHGAAAEHVEAIPHAAPGDKAVYMVLLPNTDMAHASEMPSMERCRAAIRYLTRALCIEAVKPASGDWPEEILRLIPPPDDAPD